MNRTPSSYSGLQLVDWRLRYANRRYWATGGTRARTSKPSSFRPNQLTLPHKCRAITWNPGVSQPCAVYFLRFRPLNINSASRDAMRETRTRGVRCCVLNLYISPFPVMWSRWRTSIKPIATAINYIFFLSLHSLSTDSILRQVTSEWQQHHLKW